VRDAIPVSPSLDAIAREPGPPPVDRRVVVISGVAIVLGAASALVAEALRAVIHVVTNLAFFGRWSAAAASPAANHLGLLVIVPPVVGGLIVGVMARFGSAAIRGHGIPEAMEQVLLNRSRIPPRLTVLKPVSAAIAIGTGGPFGAEGPIIATGGALGSLIGQLMPVTALERKVLLAAGAAAGMAATFGTPVAAVLLAVEFLLFEFRARSIIPVALASVAATALHVVLRGAAPAFAMPTVDAPGGEAMAIYVALGAFMGLAGVVVTRAVYGVEDAFERLPVHWMWWPALGGIAVGLVGWIDPRTLGVGYDNLDQILGGTMAMRALLLLGVFKFASWCVALGSGTSGGTLAPLFTVGGALGAAAGVAVAALAPGLGIDPRIAALVGMASLFTGASHAMLTWVVFAFETTRQPISLLPLLGACAAAYLVSMLRMRYSIMTEKIARRGTPVSRGYEVDVLRQHFVRDRMSSPVQTLSVTAACAAVRQAMLDGSEGFGHQGFPVLDNAGALVGVVTRRNLF
jgi:H+/Cl- antiporter ClcA